MREIFNHLKGYLSRHGVHERSAKSIARLGALFVAANANRRARAVNDMAMVKSLDVQLKFPAVRKMTAVEQEKGPWVEIGWRRLAFDVDVAHKLTQDVAGLLLGDGLQATNLLLCFVDHVAEQLAARRTGVFGEPLDDHV